DDSAAFSVLLLFIVFTVAQASVSVTQSSGDGPHPSSMEIELQLPDIDKKVRIPLTKTAPLDDAVVTVTDGGVSRTFSGRQAQHGDHAHYRNVDRKSVISVRHENGTKRIKGHVTHQDALYFVEPIGDFEHRVSKTNGTDSQTDGTQPERVLSRKKRRVNREATEYIVEIHILIDHHVWKTFKSIFGSDEEALTELHFYYSHIVIGMDTVFRNIGSPSISVRCIELTVAKTEADAKWMPPDSSADAKDGNVILNGIEAYAKGKRADHVMAFTRGGIGKDGFLVVAGLAFPSGACRKWKVSLVDDTGLDSWNTAAHELAHSLGASHDNREPGCEIHQKFLMSPHGSVYDLSNVANSYRFSPCTVRQIRTYLESSEAACLRSLQGTGVSQLTGSVRQGARLSLDQVCRLRYPSSPGKLFVHEKFIKDPALLCINVYCHREAWGSSAPFRYGLRAPVGTPCGSQKSCNWNGQCSYDSKVPAIDMSCFFGDINSFDKCSIVYRTITKIPSAVIRNRYCNQMKPACCKTLASICS
uniref:Peptidase M12B domain-containing protein n=2 Tax=Macrostomum lignano TaxID=282301 RepID=A0A1I8H2D7_9PLAT